MYMYKQMMRRGSLMSAICQTEQLMSYVAHNISSEIPVSAH